MASYILRARSIVVPWMTLLPLSMAALKVYGTIAPGTTVIITDQPVVRR